MSLDEYLATLPAKGSVTTRTEAVNVLQSWLNDATDPSLLFEVSQVFSMDCYENLRFYLLHTWEDWVSNQLSNKMVINRVHNIVTTR